MKKLTGEKGIRDRRCRVNAKAKNLRSQERAIQAISIVHSTPLVSRKARMPGRVTPNQTRKELLPVDHEQKMTKALPPSASVDLRVPFVHGLSATGAIPHRFPPPVGVVSVGEEGHALAGDAGAETEKSVPGAFHGASHGFQTARRRRETRVSQEVERFGGGLHRIGGEEERIAGTVVDDEPEGGSEIRYFLVASTHDIVHDVLQKEQVERIR